MASKGSRGGRCCGDAGGDGVSARAGGDGGGDEDGIVADGGRCCGDAGGDSVSARVGS